MENVIGWTLIALFCAAPVWIMLWIMRRNRKSEQQYRDQLERYQVEIQAYHDRDNERRRQQSLKPSMTTVPATGGSNPFSQAVAIGGGSSRASARSYTQSATALPATTSTTNDSALQDLAMLYVLNSALEHGSSRASIDYDAKTVSVSSPVKSDDEDSRVVQDTFSSSDSSSSWSSSDSSSSSSSDSGPSSDW